MSEKPVRKIALILSRETVESRWESHRWQLLGAIPDVGGEPRTILEDANSLQRLYPGFEVTLFPDEAEGYYLNVSSDAPSSCQRWLSQRLSTVSRDRINAIFRTGFSLIG